MTKLTVISDIIRQADYKIAGMMIDASEKATVSRCRRAALVVPVLLLIHVVYRYSGLQETSIFNAEPIDMIFLIIITLAVVRWQVILIALTLNR